MTQKLILLVEDDHEIAELCRELLEEEGYLVALAPDGEEALVLLDRLRPDVLVTDMMMPRLDGFGLLAALRKRPPPVPPALAMSAFCEYRTAALSYGARAALTKPFDIQVFLDHVHALARSAPVPHPKESSSAPVDDQKRVEAVLGLHLDQPSSLEMDAFTQRVARIFEVPICLVTIVTADRQYWTSFCGLPDDLARDRGTPRDQSFCTHAVVSRAALIVQDASENPLFHDNPLVRNRGFRFYAGVPLFGRLGEAVGTLCLLDFEPRRFSHFDLELLSVLSRRVVADVERREREARPEEPSSSFSTLGAVDAELGVLGRELFLDVLKAQSVRSAERGEALTVCVLVPQGRPLPNAISRLHASLPRAHIGRLGTTRLGVVSPGTREDVLGEARSVLGSDVVIDGRETQLVPGGAEGFLRLLELDLGPLGLSDERMAAST